jgi:hypothetical protein
MFSAPLGMFIKGAVKGGNIKGSKIKLLKKQAGKTK